MLSTSFELFAYFAEIMLGAEWFQLLVIAVTAIAVIRLFWELCGV